MNTSQGFHSENNKFAFWAEASLWSTLVSCQLCEKDLELEKLSIISQQEPASLTVNLQLFLSVKLLQYRHHQTVKHPRPAVSCDKGLIRSFPDIRHLSASRTFLLWKIFLISLVNIFIFTGTWLSFWIRNIGGYFISLLASDTGERSLWLWWCSPLMDSNDKRNFNCKLKPIVTPPWISLIFADKILYHWQRLSSVKC